MVKRKKVARNAGAASAADATEQAGAQTARPVRRKRRLRRAAADAKAEADEHKEDEVDSEDEDDDEEDDEDSDAEEGRTVAQADEVLEIEFDFRDPDELDFHAVKDLIKSGTWEFAADLNFTELADSVVGQGNIGTIIKSSSPHAEDDDDETSCGLLTALNMRQFKHLSWVKTIEQALTAKARKHASAEATSALEALLKRQGKDAEVGLLLSERFINLPPDLIAPLHKALKEDIEWSCTTPECPADERPFYFFTHFLGAVKCTGSGGASASAGPSKKRQKSSHASADANGEEAAEFGGLTFPQAEMVAYIKRAEFWFSFPVASSGDGKVKKGAKALPEHRAIFALTRKSFELVVADMRSAAKAASKAANG